MTLWVVKIGTSLLRGETATTIDGYARCFAGAMDRGDQVVLVTSGAVGLGCQKLALTNRPDTVVALQAAAAIGQGALMALYERAMERHGRSVAQVLLTRSDLADRRRYQNASGTLRQLLSWGVLPVINENDALSPAELRFGDNDTLSALVAAAVEAQQLILLTDVDRLYSSDPRVDANAEPISDVRHPRELDSLEQGAGDGGCWGTGRDHEAGGSPHRHRQWHHRAARRWPRHRSPRGFVAGGTGGDGVPSPPRTPGQPTQLAGPRASA